MNPKVTAIVPAYNEGKRIGSVLKSLIKSKLISEIIVIDDGSTDDTFYIVKSFKGITCIRNKKNLGKGESISLAIKKSKNDIIFLCDSDLKNFTTDMADKIILPVLNNETNLCLGIRNTPRFRLARKLFPQSSLFFLSGQRAFPKKVWSSMPEYYKHGYMIEAGMSYHAHKKYNGFKTVLLNYGQYIKETKLGLIKGQIKRWKMIFDIITVVIKSKFYNS